VLEQGRPLTPETCGWHYVEGLTMADDPRLALLWCKEALGHNGQRTPDGGRQVVHVGGMVDWVSGAEWNTFLAEQETLRRNRSERARNGLPLVSAAVELPDGSRVDSINESYSLVSISHGPDSSGRGAGSGSSFHASSLDWFHPPLRNGTVTRTLSFAAMKAPPVTVTFVDGKPDLEQVVFKLQPSEQSGE
jgi:hypothetical protein